MALHCTAEETEPQTRQMLRPRPGTVSWFLLWPQINPAGVLNPSSMGSASLCLLPESLYLPGLSQACSKNSGGWRRSSQVLPEVWLPLLPVLENSGALAVNWPALAYPTTDICQTAAVWEEGGMFT